jgi:hypothetical protein
MRIVIEREADKYKAFLLDYQENVLRHIKKYRDLDESQAAIILHLWEEWFDLKEQHGIKEDEA